LCRADSFLADLWADLSTLSLETRAAELSGRGLFYQLLRVVLDDMLDLRLLERLSWRVLKKAMGNLSLRCRLLSKRPCSFSRLLSSSQSTLLCCFRIRSIITCKVSVTVTILSQINASPFLLSFLA
jgi:hypothetical protein